MFLAAYGNGVELLSTFSKSGVRIVQVSARAPDEIFLHLKH